MLSDITDKEIEGSIAKTYLKKFRLHRVEYEWDDTGGLIKNYGPTILYLLFKSIKPATIIGVSNLKYEIDKVNLAKSENNVKDLLYDMSSNYSTIIDIGEHHKDYVCHIFRDLLSGPNSTFNYFIERAKYHWETVTEVPSMELIHNSNEKYNNMVLAKEWTKKHPKDDKILSLTTRISK